MKNKLLVWSLITLMESNDIEQFTEEEILSIALSNDKLYFLFDLCIIYEEYEKEKTK